MTIAEKERTQLDSDNLRFTHDTPVVATEYPAYLVYLKALSEINQRALYSLELQDRQLVALYNLGPEGVTVFERLTAARPKNESSAMGMAGQQLLTLRSLSVKQTSLSLLAGLNAVILPLQVHLRSHCELNTLELGAVEHREVLQSLVEHYAQALDGLQCIREVNTDELDIDHFNPLFTLLETLYADVRRALANDLKDAPKSRKSLPKRSKITADGAQKKLIKTACGAVLIGDLKPADTTSNSDVVEIQTEDQKELIASYTLQGEFWQQVLVASDPAPVSSTRPINVIAADAQRLFGQFEKRLNGAERFKHYCRYPQVIEERLDNEATRLQLIATELGTVLLAQPVESRPATHQKLVKDIGTTAIDLKSRGRSLRTLLCQELPPTGANLQFLFDEGLVKIALLGQRLAATEGRKNAIQEFSISDLKGSAFWFAHFHYTTAQTPKADYHLACLKTKTQRGTSYASLLTAANSPQAVADVQRGMLGKSLAERLFLPLAP